MYVHLLGAPKNILMSVRYGFMNFLLVGRYKANANARNEFCNFVGNISK